MYTNKSVSNYRQGIRTEMIRERERMKVVR